MRHPVALAPALTFALASGCAPSVMVDHWQPAAVDLAGARHAIVTDAFGRDDGVFAIGGLALDALAASPWFTAVDDLRTVDRLETDGVDAWLHAGHMVPDAVYLRFDVYEHFAIATTGEQAIPQPDGSVVFVAEERVVATTLIGLTAADRHGVLVEELEFEGRHEVVGPVDDDVIAGAMHEAARAAVAVAIAELAPSRQRIAVPIDERDEAVNRIVAPAIDGGFAARLAAADALAGLDQTPAVYNRAALLESMEDREQALPLYRAAARAPDAPPFATEVLAGAEQRAVAAAALGL
jgi:hypothetical protein